MQYELPSSRAQTAHESEHDNAMSHAGMDHDMADPRVAKAMEADTGLASRMADFFEVLAL